MSSTKSERLINLTMALLGTRRYLSKSEIFSSVAGYEGSAVTMERMFERDKDELRALGIVIDVGSHDQLFEDEVGYRISRSSYGMELPELTAEEVSLISLASKVWRDEALSNAAQRSMRKIGVENNFDEPTTSLIFSDNVTQHFEIILECIATRKPITFTYQARKSTLREVNPYELTLWRGSWYLIGDDRAKAEIRVFKVDRIQGIVKALSTSSFFDRPNDFQGKNYLVMMNSDFQHICAIKLRKGRGNELRTRGTLTPLDERWDLAEFVTTDLFHTASQVLRFGADAVAIEPQELRDEILDRLRAKIS